MNDIQIRPAGADDAGDMARLLTQLGYPTGSTVNGFPSAPTHDWPMPGPSTPGSAWRKRGDASARTCRP